MFFTAIKIELQQQNPDSVCNIYSYTNLNKVYTEKVYMKIIFIWGLLLYKHDMKMCVNTSFSRCIFNTVNPILYCGYVSVNCPMRRSWNLTNNRHFSVEAYRWWMSSPTDISYQTIFIPIDRNRTRFVRYIQKTYVFEKSLTKWDWKNMKF